MVRHFPLLCHVREEIELNLLCHKRWNSLVVLRQVYFLQGYSCQPDLGCHEWQCPSNIFANVAHVFDVIFAS